MTEQDMIRLASENVEAWSAGDWQRLREPYAEDAVYHELGSQRRFQGVDELIRVYREWKEAFPDGTGRITNIIVSGDVVALEVIWTGTHTGPLVTPSGTIQPTGRTFSEPAAQLITFRDGKIVEFRHYFDMLTMLQQIGVVPESPKVETKEKIVGAM